MELYAKLESILFFKTNGVSVKELARVLEASEDDVRGALAVLREKLVGRGITLVSEGDMHALVTVPEMADIIKKMSLEEMSGELSKAALETLSIILYRGPVARSEIDYIRGVNSSFIVRNLLVRGLVQKNHAKGDTRGFTYEPTLELLSHMGVANVAELPDYEKTREVFADFERQSKKTEGDAHTSDATATPSDVSTDTHMSSDRESIV